MSESSPRLLVTPMSVEGVDQPPPPPPARRVSRRDALGTLAACLAGGPVVTASPQAQFRLATFSADVTPPLGHALMGGGIAPAREVLDPLSARGFVLLGVGRPVVLAAIDWCEIRNDAFDRGREALAEAAGPNPGASWSRAFTSTTRPSPTSPPSGC